MAVDGQVSTQTWHDSCSNFRPHSSPLVADQCESRCKQANLASQDTAAKDNLACVLSTPCVD